MTSNKILELLKQRHSKDVFVPECKDGPTWTKDGHRRLDAWVMTRSWSHFALIGYEIKVSRSDFLSDKKMRFYLPLCNAFYVVCPPGVVKSIDELPEGTGMLMPTSTGSRLLTKKRASFREIEPPIKLYEYVIMCRSKITSHPEWEDLGSVEYWENWLKTKEVNHRLGELVSKGLSETIKKYRDEIAEENRDLKRENEKLQEVKEKLKQMEINPTESGWLIMHKLEEIEKGFADKLKFDLHHLKGSATSLIERINTVAELLDKPEAPECKEK